MMQPKDTGLIARVVQMVCAVFALLAIVGAGANASPRSPAAAFFRAPFAATSAASTIDANAWPQDGRDPGHSGYNPDEITISTQNVARLAPRWSFSAGSALTQGVAFGDGLLYAQSSGNLYAIKPTTGTLLWSATIGNPGLAATPVLVNGLVVSGCYDTGICGFSAKTGRPAYQQTCSTFACSIVTSPSAVGGLLYYQWFNGTNFYEAETPGTGAVVWQATTGNHCAANGNGTPAPALNGFIFYTLGCQGSDGHTALCAFDSQTGAPGWCSEIAVGCGNASTNGVSAAEDTVFANVVSSSCNEEIVAFDARTGREKWVHKTGTANTNGAVSPAVAKGVVYEYVASSGLQAFSAKTGKLIWTQPNNGGGQSVSVANGLIYGSCATAQAGATVCAMDAATGAILWSNELQSGAQTTPIVVNGVLYADCNDVDICAYALPPELPHK